MFGYVRMSRNSYSKFFMPDSHNFVLIFETIYIINHYVEIIFAKNELQLRLFFFLFCQELKSFSQLTVANR